MLAVFLVLEGNECVTYGGIYINEVNTITHGAALSSLRHCRRAVVFEGRERSVFHAACVFEGDGREREREMNRASCFEGCWLRCGAI